ncbi:coiled-coil domain-containing protein [Paenibacillus elgii]
MKTMPRPFKRTGWGIKVKAGTAFLFLLLTLPWPVAQAGFLDRVKDIYDMPEQIGQLQNQYNETKQELERNREQLETTLKRSEEAAEQYKATEQRLKEENSELRSRNEQLEQLIRRLEEAEQASAKRTRQIVRTALTGVLLVVLYFVLMRVIRLVVWRRNRSTSHRGGNR